VVDIKEDAKKMANLLKSGYTMLNLACPVCNNPIFRNKKGDTLCPICNRKVIFSNQEYSDDGEKKKKVYHHDKDDQVRMSNTAIFQNLKQKAMIKLKEFTDLLENEKNVEEFEKVIKILERLVKLINEIDKFSEN